MLSGAGPREPETRDHDQHQVAHNETASSGEPSASSSAKNRTTWLEALISISHPSPPPARRFVCSAMLPIVDAISPTAARTFLERKHGAQRARHLPPKRAIAVAVSVTDALLRRESSLVCLIAAIGSEPSSDTSPIPPLNALTSPAAACTDCA